jgi:DeoR family transcriptional regulator, glycerol-3-phosphate regulon repressor
MDFDIAEAEAARAMIERSDHVTILADSSKFERLRPWTAWSPTANRPALLDALRSCDVEVIVAA